MHLYNYSVYLCATKSVTPRKIATPLPQHHPLHKTPCISILLRVPLCNKKCNTKKSATPHPLYLNAIPFIKLHASLYYSVYLCATKKVQRLYLNIIPFIKLRVPLCNKKCNTKKKCNATLVRLVPSPCP